MTRYLSEITTFGISLTRKASAATVALVLGLAWLPAAAETSLTTLRRETREILKHEATREDTVAKDAAVVSLCDLYVVIRSDSRYSTSEMLRGDAAKIRRRLISIARRRESRLVRTGVPKPAGLSATVNKAVRESLQADDDQPTDGSQATRQEGFAPAPLGANPWDLVELIQRVIAPDLWDVQGGPATIQYFAMRRLLVVRATSDVHEQIRDLLKTLR